jgi:hypothetical protein
MISALSNYNSREKTYGMTTGPKKFEWLWGKICYTHSR